MESTRNNSYPRTLLMLSASCVRLVACVILVAWNAFITHFLSSGHGCWNDSTFGIRPGWQQGTNTGGLSKTEIVSDAGLDRLRDIKARIENGHFCVPWEVNMDAWWTHAPEWDVTSEDDVGLCFTRGEDGSPKSKFLRRLHDLQWGGNCSLVYTKQMWSAGWGADLSNVADGLLYGLKTGRPFQVAFKNQRQVWHYAALKNGSLGTCASRDMNCYFLPLTRCGGKKIDTTPYRVGLLEYRRYSSWLTSYVSRQQQWLRHRVYEFTKSSIPLPLSTPCAVLHVRRGDIVLEGNNSRKYYPISDYLALLPSATNDVLLLTDDANAIDEAKEFHGAYNWIYLEKKRHRGKEGGWKEHFPSGEPITEVIAILAEMKLARYCDTLIHTNSNFADILYDEMTFDERAVTRRRVDDGKVIGSPEYVHSAEDLSDLLAERRRQEKNTRPT